MLFPVCEGKATVSQVSDLTVKVLTTVVRKGQTADNYGKCRIPHMSFFKLVTRP
jgi:hypothetical protein